MIRIMRLSSIFRSIVRRSGEVLPAIVGPLALVLSSLHIFTYSGMRIWGGAVTIGIHNDTIIPLYDLNNFNDYSSGLLTMFNIFVVNDWQTIAGVYLTADRCSSPYIVYPFFIGANLIGVNILLNVLTAFFVGAFVTKVEHKNRDKRNNLHLSMLNGLDVSSANLANSANRNDGNPPRYHIYERRGYDNVISTITGDEESEVAKKACDVLETLDRLMPRGNEIGYLVCYHQSKDYIANSSFLSLTRKCINDDGLQNVVAEVFNALLYSEDGAEIRKEYPFNEGDGMLSLAASICGRSPTMVLIVAFRY